MCTAKDLQESMQHAQTIALGWVSKTEKSIIDALSRASQPDATIFLQEASKQLIDFRCKLEGLQQYLTRRPTCAVMGKVSSGKTELLRRCLGKDKYVGAILDKMPTGANDTTNCLVRISCSPEARTDDLTLDLYTERSSKHPSAERFYQEESNLTLKNLQEGREWERFLRFPTADDDQFSVVRGNAREVCVQRTANRDASTPLNHFQMYVREAKFNLPIAGDGPLTFLRDLDLVDCPGADPQRAVVNNDLWADFKYEKNNRVFLDSIGNLDLLLVVAKADPQGLRQGEQFQTTVWEQWVDRCDNWGNGTETEMIGRFAVVLTHAGAIFTAQNTEKAVGEWVKTDVQGIGFMIEANFLPTLRALDHYHPGNWPPFILVENQSVPDQYNIVGERRAGILTQLMDYFKSHHDEPVDAPAEWPKEVVVIHRIAQQLWACKGFQNQVGERQRAYRRFLEALLALADPTDRGHGQLKRTLQRWVSTGPLRAVYLDEAIVRLQQIHKELDGISERLKPRDDKEWNEQQVKESARILLQGDRWTKTSLGWRFELGHRTEEVRTKCQENRPFGLTADLLTAVIQDSVHNLPDLREQEKTTLAETVIKLIAMDSPWKRLVEHVGHAYSTELEVFVQITHFLQQRIVAIFDWLIENGLFESPGAREVLEGGESLKSRVSRLMHDASYEPLPDLGLIEIERGIRSFSNNAYKTERDI